MTSYLARLALRSLGRPVEARFVPRLDSPARAAPDADALDTTGGEAYSESPPSLQRGHDAPDAAPAVKLAATSAARVQTTETAATEHSHSVAVAAPGAASARTRALPPPAALESPARVPRLALGVEGIGTPALRSAPPDDPSAAPVHSHAQAPHKTEADRVARSIANALPRRRDGETRAPETPQVGSADPVSNRSAATAARAVRERRAATDAARRLRSATQADAPVDAAAGTEPASVSVEIGRIEVRIAPPPTAPASRPRATPEGFAGYWRLRNYLDRPR